MSRSLLCVLALLTSSLAVSAQEMGYLKAVGGPSNAGIWVDGKYIGPASRFTVREKYQVPPGEHEVTIREPRYQEFTTKVTVTPKKTAKVRYKLDKLQVPQPPFGRLRMSGGMAASFISVAAGDTTPFYVNDRFMGYVDELNNAGGGLLLPPGTYRVRFDSPHYGSFDREVKIEANKVTKIPLTQEE